MARAKRTDRAEARRRYRAYLQAQSGESPDGDVEEGLDEDLEEEAPAPAAGGARKSRPPADPLAPDPLPAGRVGFLGAFKAAYRPVHYREDIKLFFPLITKTNAIWPVVVFCGAGLLLVMIRRDPRDFLFQLSYSMIVTPLPMIPAMIAGFLAPRATWLAGIIAGFISSAAVVAFWLSGAYPLFNNAGQLIGFGRFPGAEGSLLWPSLLQLLSMSIPSSALLAAVAGWYKRFLALTGPAAQMAKQADKAKAKSKSSSGGRSAGSR